jgi:hypothetical protein
MQEASASITESSGTNHRSRQGTSRATRSSATIVRSTASALWKGRNAHANSCAAASGAPVGRI